VPSPSFSWFLILHFSTNQAGHERGLYHDCLCLGFLWGMGFGVWFGGWGWVEDRVERARCLLVP
jgi:hypothetical protein